MSFLKTLLWIVVGVVIALFCFNNWTVVSISLWGGLILDTKLPILLALAFLAGLLPPLLLWQAAKYRLRRHVSPEPVVSYAPPPTMPAGPISAVPPGGA